NSNNPSLSHRPSDKRPRTRYSRSWWQESSAGDVGGGFSYQLGRLGLPKSRYQKGGPKSALNFCRLEAPSAGSKLAHDRMPAWFISFSTRPSLDFPDRRQELPTPAIDNPWL